MARDNFDTNSVPRGRSLNAAQMGDHMPTIRAVNCTRDISMVNADITVERMTGFGTPSHFARTHSSDNFVVPGDNKFRIHQTMAVFSAHQQTDFRATSFDASSVETIGPILSPSEAPGLTPIPDGGAAMYHAGTTLTSLHSPLLFTGLLVEAQQRQSGNPLDLLNGTTLAATTEKVYRDLSQITLSRTVGILFDGTWTADQIVPANQVPQPDLQPLSGEFKLCRTVYKQDLGFTIAFVVFVAAMLLCVLWIMRLTPRRPFLPKTPASIASQLSFLAGSKAAEMLQAETLVVSRTMIYDTKDSASAGGLLEWLTTDIPRRPVRKYRPRAH